MDIKTIKVETGNPYNNRGNTYKPDELEIKINEMKTNIKVLHWIPRIICILAILFISLFALDSFEPNLTIWQQIGAFLIHLIPTYIFLAMLIVAWKWEYIGGIILTLIGFGAIPFIGMTTIPFAIGGILFVMSHNKKKKNLLKTYNEQQKTSP